MSPEGPLGTVGVDRPVVVPDAADAVAVTENLLELAGATDVYWSTPGRLADWWRDRRRQIAANV
jgi:hypothetical protein